MRKTPLLLGMLVVLILAGGVYAPAAPLGGGGTSGWWSNSFAYRRPINGSEFPVTNIPFVINGSSGFDLGGGAETAWGLWNGDPDLYYNNYSDYTLANASDHLPIEIERGNSTNYNPTNIWDSTVGGGVYHLSGNPNDSTSRNANGSEVNFGGDEWISNGIIGGAVELEPTNNEYIALPDWSAWGVNPSTGNFTVCAWINTSTFNQKRRVLYLYDYYIQLVINQGFSSGNNIEFAAFDGGTWYAAYNTSPPATNEWFLACGRRENTELSLWLNGVKADNTDTLGGNIADNTNINQIMSTDSSAGTMIDEFRIYNRSLSADEINATYQNAIGTSGYGTLGNESSYFGNLSINTTETPASPAEYGPGKTFHFNATICHGNGGNDKVDEVNFTFDGTNRNITNNTIDATCTEWYWNITDLVPGSYNWEWNAHETTENATISESGTYQVVKNTTGNSVSISISPSSTVNEGTETTATASDVQGGTITLKKDGVIVGNPHVAKLSAGTYTYYAEVTHQNYTTKNDTTTLTVQPPGGGCSDNTTYAFKANLTVTNTITIVNLSTHYEADWLRNDMQDVYSVGRTLYVKNDTGDLLAINTTGEIGSNIFFYFGNYLNNMNVSDTWSFATTPTNNYTIAENDYYAEVTYMQETENREGLPTGANNTLHLYCEGGHQYTTIPEGTNEETFTIAGITPYNKIRNKVEYSTTSYYYRTILLTSGRTSRNLWTADANQHQMGKVSNDLDDITGEYSTATLTVKKEIGTRLATVDEQYFDASGFVYWYGIDGHEYQYYISNGIETRNLGYIIVDVNNLEKTITITSVSYNQTEWVDDLLFQFNYDNNTGIASGHYQDPYNNTNWVNFTVYDTNNTQLYHASTITNSTLSTWDVTFQYAVPNTSAKYLLQLEADHETEIGLVSSTAMVGGAVLTGIAGAFGSAWLMIAGLFGSFGVLLSFGPRHVPWAVLMFGLTIAFLTGFGILQFASTTLEIFIPSVIVLLGILMLMARGMKGQ